MEQQRVAEELLAVVRGYDNQSWTVPAVFLALLALELNGLRSLSLSSLKALPVLVFSLLSIWVLLIWFNKNHLQQLRILDILKKKYNLQDLAEAYSISSNDLIASIRSQKLEGLVIGEFYVFLGGRSAARWMKSLMTLGLVGNAILLVISIVLIFIRLI